MAERVLVIAAHPDDEVLACGGTLARHAAEGDAVLVLFLADGETSRGPVEAAMLSERQCMAAECSAILGLEPPRFLGLPDQRLDTVALLDVVWQVERVMAEWRPTVVYTHHGNDLNVDHRIAHQVALTACRPLPGSTVRAVYAFETVSSTEWGLPAGPAFRPTRFVDIRAQIAVKAKAVAAYAAEMRPFPHARSHEAVGGLARQRGAQVGLFAAEAFEVLREIV